MSEKKRLLKIKEEMNKKRPKFVRYESWRYKRVKQPWRRARGIDSRLRRKEKGIIKSPNVGYRTPKKIRGLHPTGYEVVIVHNINDLQNLDPKKHIAIISRRVGKFKKAQILLEADELNILVSNPGKLQPIEEKTLLPEIAEEEGSEEEEDLEDIEESENEEIENTT
ncbi:MAG: 50S ribosomal protein L32e [Candidatus Helarchaeota archaeon]